MLGGGKLEAILAGLRLSRGALCKVRNDAVCLGGMQRHLSVSRLRKHCRGIRARVSKPKRPLGRTMLNIDLPF